MIARDAPLRLLTSLLLLAVYARVEAQAPFVEVAIPDGPAQRTFQLFFAQTKIEILYLADVVKDVRTHGVSGKLDADQAITQMIAGTGLEYEFFQNYSFVSLRPKSVPSEDAVDENVVDVHSPSSHSDRRSPPPAPVIIPLVTVTGSYIPVVFDLTSPLTVMTRREALASSYGSVHDSLKKLTFASKSGPSEDLPGSGNFNRGSSINLHGLGSGATLVLVNGRRQTASGLLADFVDVSALPITAIDRIEVLPDGASALYGSDAIAGVVNIILRDDVDGFESFLRRGSSHGGGDETILSQLFGTQWSNGKAWLGYQYGHRTSLIATSRQYAASSNKEPFGGSDFRSLQSSPGNIYDLSTLTAAIGLPEKTGPVTLNDLSPSLNYNDRMRFNDLLPDRQQHNLSIRGEHHLSDRLSILAEARFTRRDIRAQSSPAERPLAVPSKNPFAVNPFGTPLILVGYSFENEFGPIEARGRTDSFEVALGSRLKFGRDWDVKLNGWIGREKLAYAAFNQPDLNALNRALNSTDPGSAFDAFGHTTLDSTLAKIRGVQQEGALSQIRTFQALVGGPLLSTSAGTTRIVVGLEQRSDDFERGFDTRVKYPTRRGDALFTELAIPIVGDPNDERKAPRLDMSVAARHERFSDFGSTTNPKISARWSPTDRLKIRGSWGTSFKAPRTPDLYDTSQNVAGDTSLLDPTSPSGRSVVLVIQGNNPNLQEETARTWTAGFDLVSHRFLNARLEATYFATSYQRRIAVPSAAAPSDILRQGERWQAVVNRAPTQEQIDVICDSPRLLGSATACKNTKIAAIVDFRVRNLGATEARGVDIRFGFDGRTSFGTFDFDVLNTYYFRLDQSAAAGSPYVSELGTIGNPMRFRSRATLQWWERGANLSGFNANVAADYNSSYRDLDAGRLVRSLTTVVVQLGFRTSFDSMFPPGLDLSLNVANVFDRPPPFVNTERGYDALNFDPYGRVVSVTLSKEW